MTIVIAMVRNRTRYDFVYVILSERLGNRSPGAQMTRDTGIESRVRLTNAPQIGEALPRELLPLAKSRQLICGHLVTRWLVAIFSSLRQPFNESLTCCLTCVARSKE